MRIISLVPSVTETLAAWNVEPIAVTRFCERPDLPAVGGTKNPDIPAIVALEPDLVVMNSEENRREDATALEAAGITVHVVRIDQAQEVVKEMDRLARAVGLDAVPPPLAAWELPPKPEMELRAFVPIWRRPWITVGVNTYGASILRAAGIEVVTFPGSERYPTVELASIQAAAPDIVLAPTEPYAFAERHRSELEQIAPMHLVDGQDVFWWGSRTPAALDRLCVLSQALVQTLRR